MLALLVLLPGCMAISVYFPHAVLVATPTLGAAPLAVTFDLSSSSDSRGEIVSFTLDFGDGTAPASGTGADLATPIVHTYSSEGVFTAELVVENELSYRDTDRVTIVVITPGAGGLNPPPTASFTYSPVSPLTFESITFNASGSTDPGGLLQPETIVEYSWDFDDGEFATGIMATHQYSDNGEFNVTLTVIDDGGAVRSTSQTVAVRNRPPVAKISSCVVRVSLPPVTVNCSSAGSYDEDGMIVSYQWDFDVADGLDWTHPDAEGPEASHAYTDAGYYTITLRVVDDDGDEGLGTAEIRISGTPPVAVIKTTPEPPEGPAPLTVDFDGSDSYDPDGGPIVSWEWDFDSADGLWWDSSPTPPPGAGAIGATTSHTFSSAGEYKVCLRVQDDEGGYNTGCVSVKAY